MYCRVCNVKFQKRLSPLDKEVDVYCAWIDEANAINKKHKDNIGFVGGRDSDSDEDDGPPVEKIVQGKKQIVVDSDSDDEEYKDMPNPEKTPQSAVVIRKVANPYSASDKIAELGLG